MDIKILEVPIYEAKIEIVFCDNDWSKVNDKYNTNITKEYDGVVFNYDNSYVCAFNSRPRVDIVVHEVVHLVNNIFKDRLINLDLDNDEPQAYLTGWIFKHINEIIENYYDNKWEN